MEDAIPSINGIASPNDLIIEFQLHTHRNTIA